MPAAAPDIPALLAAAARAGQGLTALAPRACAAALGLDSLTLCLLNSSGLELVWYDPADRTAITFEDLQYTIGEGPTLDTAHTGDSIIVPDLHTVSEHRWPALLGVPHEKLPHAVHGRSGA
ncbi:hypothetical protein [Streptomyces alboflavus]|uniref:hypothetical protein n=1 Tax=Streptomyces alboflavus TaxID=67267 RepID=UPI0036CF4093